MNRCFLSIVWVILCCLPLFADKPSKPKKIEKTPNESQEKERNADEKDDRKAKMMEDRMMRKKPNKDELSKETTSNRAEQEQEQKREQGQKQNRKQKQKQKQQEQLQPRQADPKPAVKTVYTQALSRFQGQLKRLRQEQALVEAYAADGWRGASREKVKPVAEIRRAKEQINRCIKVIRDCVRVCDEAEGDKRIPAEMYDEDGELELDDIFCAKCLGNHSTDDNDIILCDGDCDRAYHVKCLVPAPDVSSLSEDEGWLCPACDTKIDLIDSINEEFGTEYEYNVPWDQILVSDTLPPSPRLAADQGLVNHQTIDLGRLEGLLEGADLPSEDEDDEDYKASSSGSESGSLSGERPHGELDDIKRNDGKGEKSEDSVSLISEDPGTALADVDEDDMKAFAERYARVKDLDDESGDESGGHRAKLILNGKRQRSKVDYVALSREMFGNLSSPLLKEEEEEEEDGDWIPRNFDAGNLNNNMVD
jgi:hypothetical protein